METIYYLSDIRWKRETLFAHIKYVEKSKDFRMSLGNKDEVMKVSQMAMEKRKNANAGFSCVFAVPNDMDGEKLQDFAEKVKTIFSDIMQTDYVWIGYHDSISVVGNLNKHFHIVVANLDRNGKALRINRQMLKSLHANLQGLIQSFGYTIKKDDNPIGHIGYVLTKDEEAKQSYIEYLENKKQVEKQIKEEISEYERKLEEIGNEIQNLATRTRSTGEANPREETEAPRIRQRTESFTRRIPSTLPEGREAPKSFGSILQFSYQKYGEIRRWIEEDTERYYHWRQKQIETLKKLFKEKQIIIEKIQNALEQEQGEIRAINTILRQNLQEIQEIRTRPQEPDPDNQRPKPRWGI
jgi:predicted  nucleic acid-binding Zn-ribbon protein